MICTCNLKLTVEPLNLHRRVRCSRHFFCNVKLVKVKEGIKMYRVAQQFCQKNRFAAYQAATNWPGALQAMFVKFQLSSGKNIEGRRKLPRQISSIHPTHPSAMSRYVTPSSLPYRGRLTYTQLIASSACWCHTVFGLGSETTINPVLMNYSAANFCFNKGLCMI